MTITPLFVATMALCAGLTAATWRRHRDHREPRPQRGPVPGYSMTAGHEVSIFDDSFAHPSWSILSLEEFHSPERSRLVMRITAQDTFDFGAVAHEIALEIQARGHPQVVFVEILNPKGSTLARHLYAPDGRGWSGRRGDLALTQTTIDS